MRLPLFERPRFITPEFADWYLRYSMGPVKNPLCFRVNSQIVLKDEGRGSARIILEPFLMNYKPDKDKAGRGKEKKAGQPVVLVEEEMDSVAFLTLSAQVIATCDHLTLRPEQALALMVFFHLLVTDYARSRSGISTLREEFCGESFVPGTEPVFRLGDILATWCRFGIARVKDLLTGRLAAENTLGDPTIIPPKWGDIEIYEEVDKTGERVKNSGYVLVPTMALPAADLPWLYESILGEVQTEAQNSLKQVGDKWLLTFQGGNQFYLNKLKGLLYLNILLRNPGQEIPCAKLQRYGVPGAEGMTLRQVKKIPGDKPKEEQGFDDQLSTQKVFDDQALKEIKKERVPLVFRTLR